MDIETAKNRLDLLMKKSRIHFYKPIQIAEILYFKRVVDSNLNLMNLEEYRSRSKKWRDDITSILVGRVSTSSARYQDDVFNENAIPPYLLDYLSTLNNNGVIEAYIYSTFFKKGGTLSGLIEKCDVPPEEFNVYDFINSFESTPGLKRSLDKVYEIIVFSLFQTIIDSMGVKVSVSVPDESLPLLAEFEEFSRKVISIDIKNRSFIAKGAINRVGVTNAADRGLDMWGNFGVVIQIKHLSLTEKLAGEISSSIISDRLIIVCKNAELNIIVSVLSQIGWKSKIQSIITEEELISWYEKALRGNFKHVLSEKLLAYIKSELIKEFPSTSYDIRKDVLSLRNYGDIKPDGYWLTDNIFS